MDLQITIAHLPPYTGSLLRATSTLLGGDMLYLEVPSTVKQRPSTTDVLIFLWTRRADRYVSSIMPHLQSNGPAAQDLDRCAKLVLDLDGVTGPMLTPKAAAEAIYFGVPHFAKLVGRETWTGHAPRLQEFRALVALADLIHHRTKHTGMHSLPPAPACSYTLPAA